MAKPTRPQPKNGFHWCNFHGGYEPREYFSEDPQRKSGVRSYCEDARRHREGIPDVFDHKPETLAVFAECANAELVKEPTQAMGLPAEDIKPLVHTSSIAGKPLVGWEWMFAGVSKVERTVEVRP